MAQLQRIVVAQGYWPRDYAQMSVRLQRQVLADAVRYCLGALAEPEPSLLFPDEVPLPPPPPGAPPPPPTQERRRVPVGRGMSASPRALAMVAAGAPASARAARPGTAPEKQYCL